MVVRAAARSPPSGPGRRQWRAAAIVGGLLLVVDTGGVAWAELRVSSGISALLVASVPLFMAILDRIFFGVRLPARRRRRARRSGSSASACSPARAATSTCSASTVLLGASFAWAAGSTYARVAALPRRPFLSAAMQMLCAGAMLAIVGIARGELGQVHLSRDLERLARGACSSSSSSARSSRSPRTAGC